MPSSWLNAFDDDVAALGRAREAALPLNFEQPGDTATNLERM
jgi:hypothetical protein